MKKILTIIQCILLLSYSVFASELNEEQIQSVNPPKDASTQIEETASEEENIVSENKDKTTDLSRIDGVEFFIEESKEDLHNSNADESSEENTQEDEESQQQLETERILGLYGDGDGVQEIYGGERVIIRNVQDAVEIALQASESLKIQEQQALLDMKTAKLALKDFLPTFTFNMTDADSISYHAPDNRSKSINMGFTAPIFDGGKTKIGYDMGKMSANFSYKQFQLGKRDFQSSVVQAYYEYLMARSTCEISRSLLDNAEKQLVITESEYVLGLVLETDYIDYVLYVMNLRNQLKQRERDLRTQMRKFKLLIGLPLEAELVFTEKTVPNIQNEFYLEPRTDFIWQVVENSNLELQQDKISLSYSKKQIELTERFYVPSISLEGGIGFSGTHYPLTKPSYFLKFTVAFDKLPIAPTTLTTNNTFTNGKLSGISNDGNVQLIPDLTYSLVNKNNNISAATQINQLEEKTHSIQEEVFSKIALHDDCLDSILISQQTLDLQARRLEISKIRVEKGDLKRLDYLKELEQHANEQMKLASLYNQLISSWHQLELLTDLKLGELKNVCETTN